MLEQLGLDRKEATQALGEVHDLTVSYAHNMYQLYRQLRQANNEQNYKEENHPT